MKDINTIRWIKNKNNQHYLFPKPILMLKRENKSKYRNRTN